MELVNNGRTSDVAYGAERDYAVSVVMPIYNAEQTLPEALASAACQTFEDVEIVCVDDASPDGSRRIIDALSAQDERVTIVSHRRNAGYGASMNDGIAAARGRWIAILEPDDYLRPDMYRRMLGCAEGVQALDVIKSPYMREIREIEGTPRGRGPCHLLNCSYHGRIRPSSVVFDMKDSGVTHLLRHHPSIWSAIYSKDFLDRRGIRFVEHPGAGWADNEFFYETLLQARSIAWCDYAGYVYREETPGEQRSFLRKNAGLPFDRWESMTDIVERLAVSDENINRAHVAKGFTYLAGQIAALGEGDEVVRRRMPQMFARMDPSIVAKETMIAPHLKRLYAETTGIVIPMRDASYVSGLVSEFAYAAHENGVGYAFGRLGGFVRRHDGSGTTGGV